MLLGVHLKLIRSLYPMPTPLQGGLLNAMGVPYGSKSIRQPLIDLRLLDDYVWKYFIQTVLNEEGSFSVGMRKDGRITAKITIERAIDLTNSLPKSFISSLDYGSQNIKSIENWSIHRMIVKRPPLMLIGEYMELSKRHRFPGQTYLWPRPHPIRILKTKDDRITVAWRFETENRELNDLFHDYYGMLPGTWKSVVFREVVSILQEL